MLREFKFPADTDVLFRLLPKAFRYPENPAWSIQQDEVQNMQDTMKMVRRLWPLLAVVGALSPAFRNAFRGFIWQEDNKAVGLVNTGTQGTGGRWFIGNVGVLPDYRRRGLARKLVEASVDLARRNKATMVWLDVIPGNVPAYKLYENLGFVHYDSAVELEQNGATTPAAIPLPQGYRLEPAAQFDWRPRYELAEADHATERTGIRASHRGSIQSAASDPPACHAVLADRRIAASAVLGLCAGWSGSGYDRLFSAYPAPAALTT
ncbi:MAG: GNAT family N-acetyltransferase [Anaerolineae bacterium]